MLPMSMQFLQEGCHICPDHNFFIPADIYVAFLKYVYIIYIYMLCNMDGLLYAEVLFLTNRAFPPCQQHMTFHMDLGRCKHFTSL